MRGGPKAAFLKSITVEELRALQAKGVRARVAGAQGQERSGKYNACSVVHDGQRYHSKGEFGFKLYLDLLIAQGLVDWYTRQVPFYMPGGKKYVCDFLVTMSIKPGKVYRSADVTRIVDVKGHLTKESASKISVIQSTHRMHVELVPSRQDGRYTWK